MRRSCPLLITHPSITQRFSFLSFFPSFCLFCWGCGTNGGATRRRRRRSESPRECLALLPVTYSMSGSNRVTTPIEGSDCGSRNMCATLVSLIRTGAHSLSNLENSILNHLILCNKRLFFSSFPVSWRSARLPSQSRRPFPTLNTNFPQRQCPDESSRWLLPFSDTTPGLPSGGPHSVPRGTTRPGA